MDDHSNKSRIFREFKVPPLASFIHIWIYNHFYLALHCWCVVIILYQWKWNFWMVTDHKNEIRKQIEVSVKKEKKHLIADLCIVRYLVFGHSKIYWIPIFSLFIWWAHFMCTVAILFFAFVWEMITADKQYSTQWKFRANAKEMYMNRMLFFPRWAHICFMWSVRYGWFFSFSRKCLDYL